MMPLLPHALLDTLRAIVGPQHVSTTADDLANASIDLIDWPGQMPAACIVRPADRAQVAGVVRALPQDVPVIPRGAGLSYSGGAVPHGPAVLLDLRRLDEIEIHPQDLVARVGAGTTWEQLARQLAEHGLRTVQHPPISGVHTTVGGAAAQGMPGGLDGVAGLVVVLANGAILPAGAAAQPGSPPFQRYWGPDLTGLFLGDCGALGIKTDIVLRLAPLRPVRFASFACDGDAACVALMTELLRQGMVYRAFANSSSRQPGQEPAWQLHAVVEGVNDAAAEAALDAVRALCRNRAREIDATIPGKLHAKPFSVRGFLGIEGQRWLPVHGVLPFSATLACVRQLRTLLDARQRSLADNGIFHTLALSSVGPYVTVEPMLYWHDALTSLHEEYLNETNRARFAGRMDNQAARTLVKTVREELRDAMDAHGAVHAQIGRYFSYLDRLAPESADMMRQVKLLLDPERRLNPGVLGL
ncbi:4-cresol dehydrogenase [hydroxylating] flavoprotein subunit [Pigmentiphaga humi]|uniref:D-lactate dehydrogenase (cytochrome) n=1 Tax=Pigmentiphaga humi TaxID=2478468 RepID=A0A3P4B3I3_9BURK|nr:FAD-binding oxidoreductase [Pigmentiphaga humi]VCU70864.1 4-cresol dehydrogenase [hydroxylating] flavoprotein subunit [Pigmentiphaga humi]